MRYYLFVEERYDISRIKDMQKFIYLHFVETLFVRPMITFYDVIIDFMTFYDVYSIIVL